MRDVLLTELLGTVSTRLEKLARGAADCRARQPTLLAHTELQGLRRD